MDFAVFGGGIDKYLHRLAYSSSANWNPLRAVYSPTNKPIKRVPEEDLVDLSFDERRLM